MLSWEIPLSSRLGKYVTNQLLFCHEIVVALAFLSIETNERRILIL
jgi:hypothetical protein